VVSTIGFSATPAAKFYPLNQTNTIDLSISPKLKAQLVLNAERVTVQCQGKNIQVLTKVGNLPEGQFPVQIDDFNFDGLTDVAVGESTGSSGLNWFYVVYFFNPKTSLFEKGIEDLGTGSEIETTPNQKEISGHSKDGSFMTGVSYRFQNDSPYIALESVELQGSALVAKAYKDPAGKIVQTIVTDYDNKQVKAKVLPAKAFLYDSPQESAKTKAYVIKDDQVALHKFSGSDWGWAFVEYKGSKTIDRWMHTNELQSLTPDTELPGRVEK